MKRIKFIHDTTTFSEPMAFVAHIGHVEGKEELLRLLAKYLHFPWYFGYNWNALEECINDLQWIDEYKIILIHDDLVRLNLKDFHIYLEILIYAINSWNVFNNPDYKCHEFEVIFPSRYENLIRPYEENYLVELEKLSRQDSRKK